LTKSAEVDEEGPVTIRTMVPYNPGPERLVLVGLDGPGAGVEFVLSRSTSILGRGPGASLVVNDTRASRRHCKLTLLPDPVRPTRKVVLLEDMRSTNGVRVNGRPTLRRTLRGGEKILVGKTIFRFERRDSFDAAFYGRLQQIATTDPLTGVGNRLGLSQEMERQESERVRYKRPFAVLLVDLDEFKTVNDRFGHSVGDHVLQQVSAAILSSLRDSDRTFRYGGEEFVVILPETRLDGAAILATRIRESVEGTRVAHEGHEVSVTVSVGVAEATGDSDVLDRADRALYRAKRAGRNRVRTFVAPRRGAVDKGDATQKGD
jgi:two-component system cell cycle response regulator